MTGPEPVSSDAGIRPLRPRGSFALVDDLGLDDLVVVRGRLRAAVGRTRLRAGLLRLGLLVDGGTHLLADLRGPLAGRLDGVGVVALQRLLDLSDAPRAPRT